MPNDLAREIAHRLAVKGKIDVIVEADIQSVADIIRTAPGFAEATKVLAAVERLNTKGCACITDMPGDNCTCSAHRVLPAYGRKEQPHE